MTATCDIRRFSTTVARHDRDGGGAMIGVGQVDGRLALSLRSADGTELTAYLSQAGVERLADNLRAVSA